MTDFPYTTDHSRFCEDYAAGRITVNFDRNAAGRYISARLMLPLFMLPLSGIGVALALIGWIWTGLAVIALAFVLPRLIKRGAPGFLMQQSLEDAQIYRELLTARIITIEEKH
jgi:hypothetical protein